MLLDSVPSIHARFGDELIWLDWIITFLFTIEYILRIYAVGKPWKYIFSFYGIIDFLAILPTYLGFFFIGVNALSVIRAIRILRVFRVLKLVQFIGEAQSLLDALKASTRKITVFLIFILTSTVIIGTLMYLIEGAESGFTSIPRSVYWCIVTLTTVGYGDITPQTPLGQALASVIMILGYGVLAVPTGIMSAEMVKSKWENLKDFNTQSCPSCSEENHDNDAIFCKKCGAHLHEDSEDTAG